MAERPILFSSDTPSTMRSTQPPNPEDEGKGQRQIKTRKTAIKTYHLGGTIKGKIKRWPQGGREKTVNRTGIFFDTAVKPDNVVSEVRCATAAIAGHTRYVVTVGSNTCGINALHSDIKSFLSSLNVESNELK